MAEAESDKLNTFRELHVYALDYLSGTLWVLAISLIRLPAIDSERLQKIALEIAGKAEMLFVLVVVVGGVILPYCVGFAFKPLSVTFASLLFRYRLFNPAAQAKPEDLPLFTETAGIVSREVGIVHPIFPGIRQLIIAVGNGDLERRISRAMSDANFKASAQLPSAFVVGGLIYRTFPGPYRFLCYPVGVAVFVMGIRAANYAAYSNQVIMNAAVVFGARRRGRKSLVLAARRVMRGGPLHVPETAHAVDARPSDTGEPKKPGAV